MNIENPDSAPLVKEAEATLEHPVLGDYTPAQLKKLYYRSCNVSAIAFLIGLAVCGLLVLGFLIVTGNSPRGTAADPGSAIIYLGFSAFYLAAFIGLVARTAWGRVLGIICCIFMLINIPIGLIIGLAGLFAFFGAKELFGAERITHKELKIAFKALKARKH